MSQGKNNNKKKASIEGERMKRVTYIPFERKRDRKEKIARKTKKM